MTNVPAAVDRITRWALVTIAVCLSVQTLQQLLGGAPAVAQLPQQRPVVDVYIKGIDLPFDRSLAYLLRGLQVDCAIHDANGLPLAVKQVDDDLTPRQPKK